MVIWRAAENSISEHKNVFRKQLQIMVMWKHVIINQAIFFLEYYFLPLQTENIHWSSLTFASSSSKMK